MEECVICEEESCRCGCQCAECDAERDARIEGRPLPYVTPHSTKTFPWEKGHKIVYDSEEGQHHEPSTWEA